MNTDSASISYGLDNTNPRWTWVSPEEQHLQFLLYQDMPQAKRDEIAVAIIVGGIEAVYYIYSDSNILPVRMFHPALRHY